MVVVSVCYLFYQPVDKKIKTWTLRFPAKENPNVEKTLFDWPIVLPYDVKAKYRLISRKFSATRVCIRLINQSNRSNSVRLLFLFFFARFHFKPIRKSLYWKKRAGQPWLSPFSCLLANRWLVGCSQSKGWFIFHMTAARPSINEAISAIYKKQLFSEHMTY